MESYRPHPGVILILIFLSSVLARKFLINDVIDNTSHSEFNMLTTLEVWKERGLRDCHYSPILTYSHPGDKRIAFYKRLESPEGDNYFVSFPPFSFLFAYGVFHFLHVVPGKLSLMVLNLCLHFTGAVFIYLIVFRHYFPGGPLRLHFPSLAAFVVYTFMPVMMYLHCLIYEPEALGPTLWVMGIYFSLKFNVGRFKCGSPSTGHAGLLFGSGLIIFLMVYTEWIGVFYVLVLICILVFVPRPSGSDFSFGKKGIVLCVVIVACVLALALTCLQYSSIAGMAALFRSLLMRFSERSGLRDAVHSDMGYNYFNFHSYVHLAHQLQFVLFPFGYILLILFFLVVYSKGFPAVLNWARANLALIGLALLPGLLHILVFFNTTVVHQHCIAVLGPGVALCMGFLTNAYCNSRFSGLVLLMVFALSSVLSIQYFRSSPILLKKDCSFLTQAAEIVKENSKEDEALFLNVKTELAHPYLYISFLIKRNVAYAADSTEVKFKLRQLQKGKALFFEFRDGIPGYRLSRIIEGSGNR